MKCWKCDVKLKKSNCFYLYTIFKKSVNLESMHNRNFLKSKNLMCDKCFDNIKDEEKKREYLDNLDEPYFYSYHNGNITFPNPYNFIPPPPSTSPPSKSKSPLTTKTPSFNSPQSPIYNYDDDYNSDSESQIRSPRPSTPFPSITPPPSLIMNNNKLSNENTNNEDKINIEDKNNRNNKKNNDKTDEDTDENKDNDNDNDDDEDENEDEDENDGDKPDILSLFVNMLNKGSPENNNNKKNKGNRGGGLIIIEDITSKNKPSSSLKDIVEQKKKRKRQKDEEEELQKEIELEKTYEYEWLGDNISNIDDLIEIGLSYNERKSKKRRYNLNIKKLNNLVKPLQDLKKMIGLKPIKDAIFNQIVFYLQELEDKNTDMLHTVIEGPPGVGKTHICHILASIYKGLGFLKNNKVVSVKRDDFIAKYLGQTADKTRRKIEEALGGVLFIDEAYSMGDAEGRDSYSKEAIDMLTSFLSEHPHDLICIVAGYKEALQRRFFSQNEGLSRRFTHRFELTDYAPEDLRLIFFKIVEENGWFIYDKETIPISFFEKNIKCFKYNGGDMLTLFGYCKKIHSKRLLKISVKEEILLENKKKLSIEDIKGGLAEFLKNPEYAKRLEDEDGSSFMLYT